ncbi:Uncharacterised protein [Bordetella pertussis]|nr:Uncharacterised protein [Bordetella pertussis]
MVAALPSSSPASASTNAPRHRPTISLPCLWALRKASVTSAGAAVSGSCQAGTMTISARLSACRPSLTSMTTP